VKKVKLMGNHGSLPYYMSALTAIVGTVGYHQFLKKIPETMDPIVSIMAIYLGVIVLGAVVGPFVYTGGQISLAIKQLGWIQVGIAACILLMEIGFLLMYRLGWNLSTGNVVTGVAINVFLMAIGIFVLKEDLSILNIAGVVLCIAGVAMISYRNTAEISSVDDKNAAELQSVTGEMSGLTERGVSK
jgi:drug/metabolite transporter (DMT)-like permease